MKVTGSSSRTAYVAIPMTICPTRRDRILGEVKRFETNRTTNRDCWGMWRIFSLSAVRSLAGKHSLSAAGEMAGKHSLSAMKTY